MEDKVLQDRFIAYQTDQKVNEDEQILSSSTDLFLFYSKTLTNCARFSTRKTFLDLCKMYQKWLHEYNKVLISRLNFGDKQKLTEVDVTSICIIVNTADYCRLTSKQLENKLAEVIDKDLSTLVNFEAEIESFTQSVVTSIQGLVKTLEIILDPPFAAMQKKHWANIQSVGDQSDHINQMAQILKPQAIVIRKTFFSPKFFKQFCDKFIEAILKKFHDAIFKCKPLCETGAEQMLLDLHSLKNVLIEMTMLNNDEKTPPTTVFLKILNKSIKKVEQLLKVLQISADNPTAIVAAYNTLYNDYDITFMQKILDLKGVRRIEAQNVLQLFQSKTPPEMIEATSPVSPANAGEYNVVNLKGFSKLMKRM